MSMSTRVGLFAVSVAWRRAAADGSPRPFATLADMVDRTDDGRGLRAWRPYRRRSHGCSPCALAEVHGEKERGSEAQMAWRQQASNLSSYRHPIIRDRLCLGPRQRVGRSHRSDPPMASTVDQHKRHETRSADMRTNIFSAVGCQNRQSRARQHLSTWRIPKAASTDLEHLSEDIGNRCM
jgi:hypothetical protein